MRRDFLPRDKRLRVIVQLAIIAIGIYAVVGGLREVRRGMGEATEQAPR